MTWFFSYFQISYENPLKSKAEMKLQTEQDSKRMYQPGHVLVWPPYKAKCVMQHKPSAMNSWAIKTT